MNTNKSLNAFVAMFFALMIVTPVEGDESDQPSKNKTERTTSKLYDAFDAHQLLEKHASNFKETPRDTNIVTNVQISPPGDYFKLVRIKGVISNDGLNALLKSLQSELTSLARANDVILTQEPSTTVGDRPIHLLTVLYLGATVELDSLRGFYLTYKQGEVTGAIDTFALRCVDEDTTQWKVVCAVHESIR